MNIMNKVTLRHLKENKRRTLVTIIGVIISVAMITAVATLSVSFLDLAIRETIATNGEWHVKYKSVNEEQIQAIEKDENTKEVILTHDKGYAIIPGLDLENENKPYLFFREYDQKGLKEFPIVLKNGRLPQKENEIAVSEDFLKEFGDSFAIGKEMSVEIGDRFAEGEDHPLKQSDPIRRNESGVAEELKVKETVTFEIVGVIERPSWEYSWSPGYAAVSYLDRSNLQSGKTADASVVVKDLKNDLYDKAIKLAKSQQITEYEFHSELLRYYGVTSNDNLRTTLYSLAGIIIGVIIVGSIALIYNAFAISVSERARHLGMLSSVGATKKQKLNSVLFEGAVIGAVSIPLGILSGVGGIAVTFYFINNFIDNALGTTEKLSVVVTPGSVLTACLVSLVTIFVSAYIPAQRASRISPIEAIRQTQDVKLTGKRVKTSKLIRKIFGIEAEIGLKNLKRNKRRYMATLFSLIISIVLFLTVSFFTENLKKSLDMVQEEINYDISVSSYEKVNKEDFIPLTKLKGISNWTINQYTYLNTQFTEDEVPDKVKESLGTGEDGKYSFTVYLYTLDEESFRDYAKKAGTDPKKMTDPKNPKAILINDITYYDYDARKFVETQALNKKVGDTIEISYFNYETEAFQLIEEVEIAALTGELPMGLTQTVPGGAFLIVSENVMDAILEKVPEVHLATSLYIETPDPAGIQEALEELTTHEMYVYNVSEDKEKFEQMILIMSIFTYGFITLISLISIANIFNTISTSIMLRKREFAMLRSVGMTPKGFNKMVNYESGFYGIKALLYGLPLSFGVMFLIYRSMGETFEYGFTVPWKSIIIAVVAIFIIVGSSMLYSTRKIKNENIIDALKQENI